MEKRVCKTCGTELINNNEICTNCGCRTPYYKHSFTPLKSILVGIVVFIYSLVFCINKIYFYKEAPNEIIIIIVIGLVSCIYGFITFVKNKKKSSLIGIIISVVAILLSIFVQCNWNISNRNVEYIEKTVIDNSDATQYTFLCPNDMECSVVNNSIKFHYLDESLNMSKYYLWTRMYNATIEDYETYCEELMSSKSFEKKVKIGSDIYALYFSSGYYLAPIYDSEAQIILYIRYEEKMYKDEIAQILTSLKITKV